MLRSSENTYFEPNTGKSKVLSDLLTEVMPYIVQKANEFINLAKRDIKIEAHPNKSFYDDFPFSGTVNQIVAMHASAAARSIINKVGKALKLDPENRNKNQVELVSKWEAGLQIDSIKVNLNLDERVVYISDGNGTSHDYWINFKFPHMRRFSLPIRRTRHMRQLEARGFVLKRTALRVNMDSSITLNYHSDVIEKKGDTLIGVDLGRGKAITRSDDYTGFPLEKLLEKINRKKQGSKAHKQAKIELKNAINRSAKIDIDYNSIDVLAMEKLTDMKRNKKWGNRNHNWRVGLLQERILNCAEEHGVRVIRVNAAYTSQTCADCGHRSKKNRKGNRFRCIRCEHEADADINAARVIAQRGVHVSLLHKQRNQIYV